MGDEIKIKLTIDFDAASHPILYIRGKYDGINYYNRSFKAV